MSEVLICGFDFEAENDDELTVKEGTRLITIERRGEWLVAKTEDGTQEGLIPASYCLAENDYYVEEQEVVDVDDAILNETDEENNGQVDVIEQEDIVQTIEPIAPLQKIEAVNAVSPSPPPPPPDIAEQALKQQLKTKEESQEESYEELAGKFAALQKTVENVKLTIDKPIIQEEEDVPHEAQQQLEQQISPSPPPPSPQQAQQQLQQQISPPPPSPQQAQQQLQQQISPPPPSPQQAHQQIQQHVAQQAVQQMQQQQMHQMAPPPPSPQQAQLDAQRQADELIRQEQAKIAQRNAQSQQDAIKMRNQREMDQQAHQEAYQKEMHLRQNQNKEQGRHAMSQAIDAVKNAVKADGNGDLKTAYHHYVQALQLFATVLDTGAMQGQHPVIIERMEGYLNRMSILEPEICTGLWSNGINKNPTIHRFKDRVSIILSMTKSGHFDPVPTGDEYRLKARFAATSNNLRESYRNYNIALEYYMAQHKLLKLQKSPADKKIVEYMTEMLEKAEKLKKQITG